MAFRELGRTPPKEATTLTEQVRVFRENIQYSIEPGMTVFTTPEVVEIMTREGEEKGHDPLDGTPVIEGVVGVYYPDGDFSTRQQFTGQGGIRISQHSGPENPRYPGRYDDPQNTVLLGFSEVIRIEDLKGRAWQNFDYVGLGDRIKAARAQQAPQPPRQ